MILLITNVLILIILIIVHQKLLFDFIINTIAKIACWYYRTFTETVEVDFTTKEYELGDIILLDGGDKYFYVGKNRFKKHKK